jgi:hypothetical protein
VILSFHREKFGNFLNQLETVHNVSRMAVSAIVTEMATLNSFIHSYTVKQVAEKIRKCIPSSYLCFISQLLYMQGQSCLMILGTSVSDPHQFYADPDPCLEQIE